MKRKTRTFQVVIVQQRQLNLQRIVMYVQCCCIAYLNLLLLRRSHGRRHRRCLSSLL